ncbi:MAG: mechanosensitive ion channel [Oxalicibacterium faecigallinarum]|uniref:mechanosensitive ion channel domain-containing protein n=1 Tax=Oxalicibacterium faecigallinarum TaxID=573741 RepID=UPI002806DA86|nr:mechanosensitive ion channel domain-containing protein [Oxalicibacterium faecigallinarum]MDQ7969270.1 mechanosensitive ion channel [Oxalicibacterium faecigallinarum]
MGSIIQPHNITPFTLRRHASDTRPHRIQAFFLTLILAIGIPFAAHAQSTATDTTAGNTTSYAALADLLETESTRNQLISELRTLADTQNKSGGTEAASTSAPQDSVVGASTTSTLPASPASASSKAGAVKSAPIEPDSNLLFSRNIADGIQHFIASISADVSEAMAAVRSMGQEQQADEPGNIVPGAWRALLVNLLMIAAATIVAFFLFRALAARIYARSNRWITATPAEPADATTGESVRFVGSALYRKSVAIVFAMMVDIAAILLAGAVGYGVALFAVGEAETINTLESLFINAFVAVEIAKAVVRGIFSPRFDRLRLFTMRDETATYWGNWLERVISVMGYGILVAVPVVKTALSPTIGHLLNIVIMLGVYVYAINTIRRNRKSVRDSLEDYAKTASTSFFSTLIRVLARVWHTLAIVYFTVLLIVSQIAPHDALPFMAEATLQTLLAIGIGLLLSTIVSSIFARRIRLSEDLRTRLPMLEARINSYVPPALKGFHLINMMVVVLVVLDAWRAFNLSHWIASDRGSAVIIATVHVAIILVIAALIWTTIASIIEHRLSPISLHAQPSEREKTLLSLFRNAALVVIVTLTILVVLSQIGIDIAPLIAGAGVVGLAIGFGAQKLVQDVITGVFIQLENGMNQNDVVEVAGIFGTVEKITIRSVGIRTLDGGFHMIPFSSVDKVSNHTRDFAYHYGEYAIAYREDVDNAIHHLKEAFKELMQDEELAPSILEEISIPGVTSLHERGFNIRVLIKTAPGMQWMVQRAFNRLVTRHFAAAGIEIPYPHTVLAFSQDKEGNTSPLPIMRSQPAQ